MKDVLIIGGGIGGLTLALALHERGIPVRLFEAAPEFKPLGAGLNLLPHAVEALAELGLVDAISAIAVETYDLVFLSRSGRLIHREFRGRYNGHRWPQFSVHRADLHQVLVEAYLDRIGAERLHLGARCARLDEESGGVAAEIVDGRDGHPMGKWHGSVAIGCDGLRSSVRRQFFPEEGEPIYAGVVMWRGVAAMPKLLSGATMILAGSLRTGKLVAYPVRRHVDRDGLQLLNWCAELKTDLREAADWNRIEESADHLDTLFADLALPMIRFRDLLERTATVLTFPMVDRDPLDRWTFGHVTLLGDAAHPMYPFGSNGACQAILDAMELARCLATPLDTLNALQRYEAIRRPATRDVVLLNRRQPPDEILEIADRNTRDNPALASRDIMAPAEINRLSAHYKSVTGFRAIAT